MTETWPQILAFHHCTNLRRRMRVSAAGRKMRGPRGDLYSTANDPETANDPQNGPQMILDRK